jgi:galactose mutarotase-like enzyme
MSFVVSKGFSDFTIEDTEKNLVNQHFLFKFAVSALVEADMITELENALVKIGVESKGAELISMIRKEYTLTQHGFARDMEFDLVEKSASRLTYQLRNNESTLSQYPFEFRFNIGYELNGNKLTVLYEVQNTGNRIMYFAVGAHPGFNFPLSPGENLEDYVLEFETEEKADRYYLEDGLISGRTGLCLDQQRTIPLSRELFQADALVFQGLASQKVALKSRKSNKSLTVEFAGFPYLGIWSKPGAPFVCIEPWVGIADRKGTNGDFTQKEGMRTLQPGQEFGCRYHLILG